MIRNTICKLLIQAVNQNSLEVNQKEYKNWDLRNKNSKQLYYLKAFSRFLVPRSLCRSRLKGMLQQSAQFDQAYLKQRVDYYNRLSGASSVLPRLEPLADLKLPEKRRVYYFDSYEYMRYFSYDLRANFLFGDITHVPEVPAFTKSRPIHGDNANSVLMKFNKIRHFQFVDDPLSFADKKNILVGRSHAKQENRIQFLEMYFDHPMCNLGQINQNENSHKWQTPKMTIREHLDYKFILCLEGDDVATNLKWVMSSNSLAVMPKPQYETWFMEGMLIPNVHYVEIKADFSDLEERMNYYINHPDEANKIIQNAHAYIEQFKNKKQENLISLLVMKKYFEETGQTVL